MSFARLKNQKKVSIRKAAAGFTLMELVVVIALIGIMLFLTIPQLKAGLTIDPAQKAVRRIVLLAQKLRLDALTQQKQFVLQLDLDGQRFGFGAQADIETQADETDETIQTFYALPKTVRLTDVVLPDGSTLDTGTVGIDFGRQGYVRQALVHLEGKDGDQLFTLVFEPFLPRVQIKKGYHRWND